MNPLLYALFTAQALAGHRRYNVSVSYMRDALYLQYRRRLEGWDQERYERELLILGMRHPYDALQHVHYRRDVLNHDAATAKGTAAKEEGYTARRAGGMD